MKVCAISANLGSYDTPHPWVEQVLPFGVELEVHRLNDENFPPRPKAMTSRLQCGIPKMWGWKYFSGADVYLWVDASCVLSHPRSIEWFLYQLGDADIAVFRHPDRNTIEQEYRFVKEKLEAGNKYLTERYSGEWLDDQIAEIRSAEIDPDIQYRDLALYASTAFIYRPNGKVVSALKEWWSYKTLFLLHDQLAFPFVLSQANCYVKVIREDYRKCEYIEYVRNKKRAA